MKFILDSFGTKKMELSPDIDDIADICLLGFRISFFHVRDQVFPDQDGEPVVANAICLIAGYPFGKRLFYFLY